MVNAKARTLSLKCERFVSAKNRKQFAILTKQKTLTCCKSAFYSTKKGEQRSPFAERGYDGHIFTENRHFIHFRFGEGKE